MMNSSRATYEAQLRVFRSRLNDPNAPQGESARLRAHIAELQKQMETESTNYTRERRELNRSVQTQEANIERQERQIRELRGPIDRAQQRLDQFKAELAQTERAPSSSQTRRLRSLERTVERYKKENQPEINRLQWTLGNARNELEASTTRLEEVNGRLNTINTSGRQQIESFNNTLEQLEGFDDQNFLQFQARMQKSLQEAAVANFSNALTNFLNRSEITALSTDLVLRDVRDLAKELELTEEGIKEAYKNNDKFDEKLNNTPLGIFVNKKIAQMEQNICQKIDDCGQVQNTSPLAPLDIFDGPPEPKPTDGTPSPNQLSTGERR